MCGIVGLLVKKPELRGELGAWVSPMLDCMGSRGPDSAGLAVFAEARAPDLLRYSLYDILALDVWLTLLERWRLDVDAAATLEAHGQQATLFSTATSAVGKDWLSNFYPHLHCLSVGHVIDLYKDIGHPRELIEKYRFAELAGTHAVGHTRMATESAVSPAHAHPFTSGEDFCLVHNGSLSNPHSIRRKLERRGIRFETDNDTEAACRFLEWRMSEGDSLGAAIHRGFAELDGFYTLLIGTATELVLVRDAFACKPAVAAETDDYVAISSEFQSLAHLPGIQQARVFEPAPEQIYRWHV